MTSGRRDAATAGATYRRALQHPEFAALYGARVLSDWGDQLARVAISALVLHRSGSALFAATVFAVSFLPKVFGQALLGPVADRVPRRTLMVSCDALRAATLVALVGAVGSGLPLLVLLMLLFLVELAGAPFFAASRALLTEVFTERALYLRAFSLLQMSFQFNQVAGIALGGVVVVAVGAARALWLDAATFAVSGVLLLLFVRHRPAAVTHAAPGLRGLVSDVRDGFAFLRRDVPTRSLVILAWLSLLAIVAPEAVALPYAAEAGASTAAGGVLLAAGPLGAFVGVLLVSRWEPAVQVRRLVPSAMCVPIPLLVLFADPPWQLAAVLFVVAGGFQGFMVPLMATFSLLSPEAMRGRLSAVAGAGFALVSALSFVLVGALADGIGPGAAVALSAASTLVALLVVWVRWPRRQVAEAAGRAYS